MSSFPIEAAADLAATAALLEMGEKLGVSHLFDADILTAEDIAATADLPTDAAQSFVDALLAAALIVPAGHGYTVAADFPDRRHAAGYISWAINANRPYIDHIDDYLRHPVLAREKFLRNGREVAVSSKWIGEQAFYPLIMSTILGKAPAKMVDLGSGAAGLLIKVLTALPATNGVAVDISSGACAEARAAAGRAGVADRLTVVQSPIQALVEDPAALQGADLIHAGFVFHDLLPEEEATFDALLAACRDALAPGGVVAITDSVPYADSERERRFSSVFTYTHILMGRQLLTEEHWLAKFAAAGFSDATCDAHRFPGGRLFVATK
ncbi:CrtT-methyltransferase-like protein [Alloactinosynnema sp. L-07]|uniref:class I SAM-dependent methyltransferase n=1 Tax=Alloactinosynnema sp. L-07 TaxID=1653480 RepID=UPI00065F03F0|nr:class I SAM-dependent methyltransferase [Alloactinosynnema sp. L-07]CRK57288.1 CrtT-methyltransferase-like protein [Alloactinosynnema sp. L-07]